MEGKGFIHNNKILLLNIYIHTKGLCRPCWLFHVTTNSGWGGPAHFTWFFPLLGKITWCGFCRMTLIRAAIPRRASPSSSVNTEAARALCPGWDAVAWHCSAVVIGNTWRMGRRGVLPAVCAACFMGKLVLLHCSATGKALWAHYREIIEV